MELLEDALPRLDSLFYLLARAENSSDDLATLRECVEHLPRIDEAIDKANQHEQAISLTQAVGARKHQALLAANERLIALGHDEATSLRAAISFLLDLMKREGTQPKAGELRLLESPGLAWRQAFLSGALLAVVEWVAFEYGLGGGRGFGWSPISLALCALSGVMGALLILHASAKATPPWVLLPDRLFLPARWPKLSREIPPGTIQKVSAGGEGVKLEFVNESLELRCSDPARLVTSLRLLGGRWLSGLTSPARPFVVVSSFDESTKGPGRTLISQEGLLFIANDSRAVLFKALCDGALPKEPTLDEVLALIAHLPKGRWAALGEHLANSADAIWLSSEVLELEGHVANKRIKLVLEPQRAEAEAMLARLAK